MKTLTLIVTALTLVACAKKTEFPMGSLTIQGSNFVQSSTVLFRHTVESSVVMHNDTPTYLIDQGMIGNLSIATEGSAVEAISNDKRFSYVFKHDGTAYMFFTVNNATYLSRSVDLINWVPMNNSLPVLKRQMGTHYTMVWNVGVAIDDQGVWHMLVETSDKTDGNASLMYSTATLSNDLIDFEPNKTSQPVIPAGGNPYLTFVPGKGLLAVYGYINEQGYWDVRAATMTNGVWNTNNDFKVSAPGIDIADPHLVETPNGLIMTLSYAQVDVYKLTSTMTMKQLFNSL